MVRYAALLVALGAAACGAGRPASTAMPSPASEMPGGDPRGEIERLSAEIDQQRGELGLAAPSPLESAPAATPMTTVPRSTDEACTPANTERCTSSCTISDSICSNAARICELAQELPGDPWAAEKCETAKQTCDAAHAACCGCT